MKKRFLILLICACCVNTFAQRRGAAKKPATNKAPAVTDLQQPAVQPPATVTDNAPAQVALPDTGRKFTRPVDGYYEKKNIMKATVTPYANVREADVVFAKRIWREIDLREKMNSYMASPKSRLIDVLMDAITAGELTAYDPTPTKDDPDGDAFSQPLKPDQAMAKLADSALVTKSDSLGNIISSTRVAGEFNPDSIVRFRIKEDWIFDKQRSVFEPRIIGIAPLIKPKSAPGMELDLQPAFWIYFPDARQVLATKEVVSSSNDATGLSYDDVFMKRMFSSYIVKQSNNQDERIKDYAQGIDRLYESQKIKKDLMDWELDLWQY